MSLHCPRVLLLGPARHAVSGVSTHLNQLFGSTLSTCFELQHFHVGSEGRRENYAGILLRALGSPIHFAARLAVHQTQIVHINTSLVPKAYWRDAVYLAIAKALRRKVVYQIHGGELPGDFLASSRVLSGILRRILMGPDVLVVLSERELSAYRDFVPTARSVLIANAVDIHDADLRRERYTSTDRLEIAYLGRLDEAKGILDVVAALALLRDRGIDAHLSIGGSGPAEQRLREMITAARVGDRVQLLGAVFGSKKQLLWRGAHVFAFPTHREGLPYALLESMAAGAVPVVVPVGAIPDVVENGVHGIFVPPSNPLAIADALERLHRDRERMHRMALAARQRVQERYSIPRLAADFERLYLSLAPAPAGVAAA